MRDRKSLWIYQLFALGTLFEFLEKTQKVSQMTRIWTCFLIFSMASAFDISGYLGTKSPYPLDYHPSHSNELNCAVRQVHLLSRHGSRYPTGGAITKYQALEEYFLAFPNVTGPLSAFHNPYELEWQGELHSIGIDNMIGMGTRFGKRYHYLLNQSVMIQASNKVRKRTQSDASSHEQ